MVERLAPGVYLLELGWPSPFGANAYLLEADTVTLVDTGFPLNRSSLQSELADTGTTPGDIDRVLLTHYDIDHVGGLSRLVPELQAPVFLGASDLDLIFGKTQPPLLNHKGLFHRGLRTLYSLPNELSFHPVHDGDQIDGFTAYHTPGHNPGHMVYIHEDLSVGLLGDLVWENDGDLTIPIWLDSYDMGELRASVQRIAIEASHFEVACVGHGDPLKHGGMEALRALAARLEDESNWLP